MSSVQLSRKSTRLLTGMVSAALAERCSCFVSIRGNVAIMSAFEFYCQGDPEGSPSGTGYLGVSGKFFWLVGVIVEEGSHRLDNFQRFWKDHVEDHNE